MEWCCPETSMQVAFSRARMWHFQAVLLALFYNECAVWYLCSQLVLPCNIIITACKRSYGKVMFSVLSVVQSVILSIWGGFHVAITHDASDLNVQGPDPLQDLPPASEMWWSRLETYSNLFTWEPHCTPSSPKCFYLWLNCFVSKSVPLLVIYSTGLPTKMTKGLFIKICDPFDQTQLYYVLNFVKCNV